MSCVNSPRDAAADGARLDEALARVAEESFFAMTEPLDGEAWRDAAAQHDRWLTAQVRFRGAFDGSLRFVLPRPLVAELASAFLGMDADEADADHQAIPDLAGEFANMVCGCWLTALGADRVFDLDHPTVTPEPPGADASHHVSVNGAPVALCLRLDEA
jgi:hypothetical protein